MTDNTGEQTAKPPCHRDDAKAVVKRLRDAGHMAYFAGGCVRDLLLGREPADYDIATGAPPQVVRTLFGQTQAVGAKFGVILVRHGRSTIEVATFRTDGSYVDGRRPQDVTFSTAQEDAQRRDFTINGLFLDPLTHNVIDYVDGQSDLAARVIRAIGSADARFAEDHLRLLRAVRFAARFGFQIEPGTGGAIKRHAAQLARISPERIAEELRLMLMPSTRTVAWRLLCQFDLAAVVLRFLPKAPAAVCQPADILERLEPENVPFGLALAAIGLEHLLDLSVPRHSLHYLLEHVHVQTCVRAMRQALKVSNHESDQLGQTLEGLGMLLSATEPSLARLKRFLARPTAPLSRRLLAALPPAAPSPVVIHTLQTALAALAETDVAPPPLITGDDLTNAGFQPGPTFKKILDAVYDAQLENRIRDKREAMAMAKDLSAGKP